MAFDRRLSALSRSHLYELAIEVLGTAGYAQASNAVGVLAKYRAVRSRYSWFRRNRRSRTDRQRLVADRRWHRQGRSGRTGILEPDLLYLDLVTPVAIKVVCITE